MESEVKEVCPGCRNQCPADQLRCPRGMEYFGRGAKQDGGGRPMGRGADLSDLTPDDAVIVLLRKCGHYLHHNFGQGETADSRALLAALSDEEKKELLGLLKKCLQNWQ